MGRINTYQPPVACSDQFSLRLSWRENLGGEEFTELINSTLEKLVFYMDERFTNELIKVQEKQDHL
jgi:hypothetical protein